jgi:hypothetical protein
MNENRQDLDTPVIELLAELSLSQVLSRIRMVAPVPLCSPSQVLHSGAGRYIVFDAPTSNHITQARGHAALVNAKHEVNK